MPARNPGESEPSGGGEPRPYEKNIYRHAQLFTTLCIYTLLSRPTWILGETYRQGFSH